MALSVSRGAARAGIRVNRHKARKATSACISYVLAALCTRHAAGRGGATRRRSVVWLPGVMASQAEGVPETGQVLDWVNRDVFTAEECSVCFDIMGGDCPVRRLACGHGFHHSCIQRHGVPPLVGTPTPRLGRQGRALFGVRSGSELRGISRGLLPGVNLRDQWGLPRNQKGAYKANLIA